MKQQIVYMDNKVSSMIDLPSEKIDLEKWFCCLTDDDYRSFSPDHLAMGMSNLPGGGRVYLNLEKIGSALILHHYVPEITKKHYLKLVSEQSSVFQGKRTITIRVIWELCITHVDSSTSELSCRVTTATDNRVIAWIGRRAGTKTMDKHTRCESALFAKDIEKKIGDKVIIV